MIFGYILTAYLLTLPAVLAVWQAMDVESEARCEWRGGFSKLPARRDRLLPIVKPPVGEETAGGLSEWRRVGNARQLITS